MSKARSIPLRDAELVETELLLADLESLERQKEGAYQTRTRPGQGGQGAAGVARAYSAGMEAGRQARTLGP